MVDAWKRLGIAKTDDLRRIKQAYAARVKCAHPEDDPAGFQELRQAYEAALEYARWCRAHATSGSEPTGMGAPSGVVSRVVATDSKATQLREFEAHWVTESVQLLMDQVEELHDDPVLFASEGGWRTILANECLWNVDVRQGFERSLLMLLVRNLLDLTAAVRCLLEHEFHWSEEKWLLSKFLADEEAEPLLKSLEQAPLERAEELCAEGRYEEAEALLKPIAADRKRGGARAVAAQELLDRFDTARAIDRFMRAVKSLKSDDTAWRSEKKWHDLLGHDTLRDPDTRIAAGKTLFAFLARHGEGLSVCNWRQLDDAFQWTSHFSAEKLARGQQLCPLMVQHIESLLEDEKHEVIVTRWAAVISRLEGEAGRKAQAILERTLSSIVERAESLEAQSQYLKAIAEVRSVIALLPGAVRGRADALLARCNAVFVATFERIYEEGRYAIVIAELEPVVATMEQGLAGQARLVLARSYLMHGNPGWAAQHLSEVLKHEPGNIQALLLIAIAYRAKGLLDRASDSYQKVLRLEPENEPAARGYEEVRRQQARPDLEQQQAPLYCPRCGCGSLEAVVTEDIHGLYWLRCTSCRAEFNARDAKHNGHESQSHEPRPQGESQPHDESQSRAPWWMRWRRRWWGSA